MMILQLGVVTLNWQRQGAGLLTGFAAGVVRNRGQFKSERQVDLGTWRPTAAVMIGL